MSEIQAVEGRPIKKGMSPGRRSAVGALAVLVAAIGIVVIGQALQPASIPPDHDLALITADGVVQLARSDGSAAAPLTGAGIPADATAVQWAPGGDFVGLRNATELTVVDREGVVAWRHALSLVASVAWSPDGSRVAIYDGSMSDASSVTTDAILEILTSTGELLWKVPLPEGFGIVTGFANLAWSPDGRSVVFTGTTERVEASPEPAGTWLGDVDAQALRRLTQDPGTLDYGPAWSADGQLYIARLSSLQSGIWRLDPSNGEGTAVLRTTLAVCPLDVPCASANLAPLAPSPDGGALAFREPTFGLSVLDIESGSVIRVQEAGVLAGTRFAWTADGSGLLFLHHAGAIASAKDPPDLVRYDVASGTTTLVVAGVRGFDLLASPE